MFCIFDNHIYIYITICEQNRLTIFTRLQNLSDHLIFSTGVLSVRHIFCLLFVSYLATNGSHIFTVHLKTLTIFYSRITYRGRLYYRTSKAVRNHSHLCCSNIHEGTTASSDLTTPWLEIITNIISFQYRNLYFIPILPVTMFLRDPYKKSTYDIAHDTHQGRVN